MSTLSKCAIIVLESGDILNISLNYIKCGTGENLILLHGNGEDMGYFSNQVDFFAKSFTVYAVDTRGHGDSPRGNGPFTLSRFADDLLAFMDGHQIEKAHLLGFSDGGNIALIFALRYPDRVDKLVLNGANIFPEGLEDDILKEIRSEYEKLSSPGSAEQIRQRELLSLMVNEPHISPLDLGKISAPSLVIAGTKDMIKAEHTRLIAESLPNSQLAFISGGHFIAASNPKKFNQTVFDFLMN